MSGFVFDYVTGDPDNLTGGGDAAMDDIQGSFFDVRTWLNSGVLAQLAASTFIVGEVRWLAGPPPDATWIPCDFRSLTQSGNVKLFNAIGTTYGPGDTPGSTFNVPDLRGRAPVGTGAGPGLTARVIGTKWGVEAVSLTDSRQNAPHNHGVTDPGHMHFITASRDTAGGFATTNLAGGTPGGTGTEGAVTGVSIQSNGGGMGHENAQPSIAIPAYIYAGT